MFSPSPQVDPTAEVCRAVADVPEWEEYIDGIVQMIELGELNDDMIEGVTQLLLDACQRLAYFRDGAGFGRCPRSVLEDIERLAEDAARLLDAMTGEDDISILDCVAEA